MAARERATRDAPVTITDVAEATGVFRAPVSRVFTHPHLLSPEPIERVRAVAERTCYAPNATARALSTGRAGDTTLIMPAITSPFFALSCAARGRAITATRRSR